MVLKIPKRTAIVLVLACFLQGCVPGAMMTADHEFLEGDSLVEEPEPSTPYPLSLIWVVSPNHSLEDTISALEFLAERYDHWNLVLALPSASLKDLSPEQKSRLARLGEHRRVTLAAQLYGSLPLGMLTSTRRFLETHLNLAPAPDIPQRILRESEVSKLLLITEELWLQTFPQMPNPGLVLPLGQWPAAIPKFKALKDFSWVVTASTTGLTGCDGSHWCRGFMIPASSLGESSLRGIVAIDETYSPPAPDPRPILDDIFRRHDNEEVSWQLRSLESWGDLTIAPKYPDQFSCLNPCSSWAGPQSAGVLWGTSAQEQYWATMAQWRKDIHQYQNSGKATISTLDQIWEEYYRWLDYRLPSSLARGRERSSTDVALEQTFIAGVKSIYQKMFPVLGKTARLADTLDSAINGDSSQDLTAGARSQLKFFDRYDNFPQEAGIPNIDSLDLSWNDQEITFQIRFSTAPREWPLMELYIDLNNQSYAGASDSADGRLHAAANDYWEYLIRAGPESGLTLYRYSPQGAPRERAALKETLQWREGVLSGRFPRLWIAGKNPRNWGWALCSQPAGDTLERDCLHSVKTLEDVLPFMRPDFP
ncbi:MAG: hypothetical protein HY547_00120 [Elusimicrobia bacterium]|nr:hypothetical protein [Elusimicrobiota bacterium]